jgi:type II secretory pathway pseudopilin PulG
MFYLAGREVAGGRGRGISLLEVIVGIAILTSLALAAILIIVPVSRQARINREVATANTEARRVLEKVQAAKFKDIVVLYPNGSAAPIISLPGGKVTTTYENPAADPLILRAVLTWDSPDLGPMMRTFFTVRTE